MIDDMQAVAPSSHPDASMPQTVVGDEKERTLFKSLATMRQGTASSLPGTWERYTTLDAARLGARQMLRDDRVLRVMIVSDGLFPRFAEWVDR